MSQMKRRYSSQLAHSDFFKNDFGWISWAWAAGNGFRISGRHLHCVKVISWKDIPTFCLWSIHAVSIHSLHTFITKSASLCLLYAFLQPDFLFSPSFLFLLHPHYQFFTYFWQMALNGLQSSAPFSSCCCIAHAVMMMVADFPPKYFRQWQTKADFPFVAVGHQLMSVICRLYQL